MAWEPQAEEPPMTRIDLGSGLVGVVVVRPGMGSCRPTRIVERAVE